MIEFAISYEIAYFHSLKLRYFQISILLPLVSKISHEILILQFHYNICKWSILLTIVILCNLTFLFSCWCLDDPKRSPTSSSSLNKLVFTLVSGVLVVILLVTDDAISKWFLRVPSVFSDWLLLLEYLFFVIVFFGEKMSESASPKRSSIADFGFVAVNTIPLIKHLEKTQICKLRKLISYEKLTNSTNWRWHINASRYNIILIRFDLSFLGCIFYKLII